MSTIRGGSFSLTENEQRLCLEIVDDVQRLGFPGSVLPDEKTPMYVIEAAYSVLIVRGWKVSLDHRRLVILEPHPDAT